MAELVDDVCRCPSCRPEGPAESTLLALGAAGFLPVIEAVAAGKREPALDGGEREER